MKTKTVSHPGGVAGGIICLLENSHTAFVSLQLSTLQLKRQEMYTCIVYWGGKERLQ